MKEAMDLWFSYMNINLDNHELPVRVQVCDYVEAKTKDLKAFGYSNLTEDQVLKSVKRVLDEEKLVDVIDHFIKADIVLDEK